MKNQNSHHHIPLIASLLTVLIGVGMFAQLWVGGASAQTTGLGELRVANPTANSVWSVGHWYDITIDQIQTGMTGGGNFRVDLELTPIPGAGGPTVRRIGSINGVTQTPGGSYTFAWKAGYYEEMNLPLPGGLPPLEPWEGQTKITAHLIAVTTNGDIPIATAASDTFIINRTNINITDPAESTTAPTTWQWGTANETVSFDTIGDVRAVDVKLKRASNPQFSIDLVSSCTVVNLDLINPTPHTCTFDIPNQPAGVTNGTDYTVQITEVAPVTNPVYTDLAAASRTITMGGQSVSGTYKSKPFAIASTAARFMSVQTANAIYSDALANGASVSIGVGFMGGPTGATNLCVANAADCASRAGFVNGYYMLPLGASGEDILLNNLNAQSIPWLTNTTFIQFQIQMSTDNYFGQPEDMPWVQNVSLGISVDTLGVIGLVSGNPSINLARGQSIAYPFIITRDVEPTYNGSITWNVVPASNQGISFAPASGTVSFAGNDPQCNLATNRCAVSVNIQADATAASSTFSITATPDDAGKTITPHSVLVAVQGSGPSPFTLNINPASRSVGKGSSTTYSISLANPFAGDINLVDNLNTQSIFGSDVTVSYNPASKKILAGTTGPVVITVAAASSAASAQKIFTVTGTSGGSSSSVSATLDITDANNLKDINLELTAPIEGGKDTLQPVFTFRLYNAANLKVFEQPNIKTVADKATVTIDDLTVGGNYRGFIRSTRHLWREGTSPITIASTTAQNYTMSFAKLLAGDLDANNAVNAVDIPVFTRDYGKTQAGLIPDIDGNGSVNALDIVAIVANWLKLGSTLPGN